MDVGTQARLFAGAVFSRLAFVHAPTQYRVLRVWCQKLANYKVAPALDESPSFAVGSDTALLFALVRVLFQPFD